MRAFDLNLGDERGLTHVLDKGLGPRGWEDLLETAGEYIDIVKLGWGTAYVTANLARKLEVLKGKPVVIGGTFFEVVYVKGRLDDYKSWLHELGLTHVEISDGTVEIPRERKLELIAEFSRDFTVLSEVGAKDSEVVFAPEEWVRWIEEELAAGAWKVITEGREGGTSGVYRPSGEMRTGLIDEIVAHVDPGALIFEAPTKASQAWFIKRFGPAVNLGNIPVDEVIPLETLRRGLRADTLAELLGAPPRRGPPGRGRAFPAGGQPRHEPGRAAPGRLRGDARAGDRGEAPRGLPRARVARLLLPEGGVGAARHAARDRPRGTRLRARHPRALPGDLRDLARARTALRDRGRGLRGPLAPPPGRSPRRGALGAGSHALLCDPQDRPALAGARRARRVDHRPAPRPVSHPRERAQARLGRRARALEGKPACRLGRRALLRLPLRARAPLQPAPRPRLLLDRLHPLHASGCRPRRALGRPREDRVRAARPRCRRRREGGTGA